MPAPLRSLSLSVVEDQGPFCMCPPCPPLPPLLGKMFQALLVYFVMKIYDPPKHKISY